jgi:hypothetical protein
MSVVANENNDVTLFREVNCKMRLFAMKYSIEFEEKINQYNSLLYRKKIEGDEYLCPWTM